MLTPLVQNLALLAVAGLVAVAAARRGVAPPAGRKAVVGALLGGVAALVMLAPATGPGGAALDARSGPILLAGFIGGPVGGAVAASVAAAARAALGGPYAASGVLGLFAYAAVGAAVGRAFRREPLDPPSIREIATLALFGAPAAASALVLIPAERALSWVQAVLPVVAAVNVVAVAITGFVIRELYAALAVNRRLAETTSRLEARLAAERAAGLAKSRFLASLSHELRTPLNAVIGLADVIRTLGPERLGEARAREALAALRASGLHLHDLVENLLAWSESEREDAPPFALAPVPAGAAAERAIAICRPAAEEAGVRLVAEVDACAEAEADRRALERCLVGLLSNAIAATPPGGSATLRVARAPRVVVFETLDRGPGVPEDVMSRLGEPFLRPKDLPHRTGGGVGLGLAIVVSLARRLGGTVELAPREGGGTRARLTLRAADRGDTRRPAAVSEPGAAATAWRPA